MRNAVQSDWQNEPLPMSRATVRLDHRFRKEEMAKIRRGLVPQEMEDKWFIYWSDDTLYLHRSWTGFCIYAVRFESLQDGGARMAEAQVNRDPEQYRETSDAIDADTLLMLVKTLLLRQAPDLPGGGRSTPSAANALAQWALLGRASLGQVPSDADDAPRITIEARDTGNEGDSAPTSAGRASDSPRDYFAELYIAALFGDAGWSVYFPKRDVGFDFIATKPVRGEVLLRPVQVKGLYPTSTKLDKPTYGFRGQLTATHASMVVALPYFHSSNRHSPEIYAFIPLDRCKARASGDIRAEPAKFVGGHAVPRRDSARYFGAQGLALIEHESWGHGA